MDGHIVVAGFTFTMEEWLSVGDELGEIAPDEPPAFPYAAYAISFDDAGKAKKKPAAGWRARQVKKKQARRLAQP
jgi:hypothetical protein